MPTSLGLKENVEAALAYLLGFISGLLILVLERESNFVRFHAVQSTVTFLGLWILASVLRVVPPFGAFASILVSFLSFLIWIYCIIRAYRWEYFKLPIAGDVAESFVRPI